MPPLTTIHHHLPPAKIYSPSPSTSQNISTTTHHHSPPAKIYPPQPTTTHHNPRYIHQHPPPPTNSQNLFYKKPFIRNLNSRPAISKKLFYTWPSPLFFLHKPEMAFKSVDEPLHYAKLV